MGDQLGQRGNVVAGRFSVEEESSNPLNRGRRPLSAIVGEIIGHLQEIMRSEMLLARAEIFAEIGKAKKKSAKFAAGVVLLLYAVGFLLLGATAGLAQVVSPWLAAVIVGVILTVAAVLLLKTGLRDLREIRPRLDKTTRTLQEDLSWIKKPMQ